MEGSKPEHIIQPRPPIPIPTTPPRSTAAHFGTNTSQNIAFRSPVDITPNTRIVLLHSPPKPKRLRYAQSRRFTPTSGGGGCSVGGASTLKPGEGIEDGGVVQERAIVRVLPKPSMKFPLSTPNRGSSSSNVPPTPPPALPLPSLPTSTPPPLAHLHRSLPLPLPARKISTSHEYDHVSKTYSVQPINLPCPSCDYNDCYRPRRGTRPRTRAAQSMFFAGFVAGPWLWLIGGWLLGPDGTVVSGDVDFTPAATNLGRKQRRSSGVQKDGETGLENKNDEAEGMIKPTTPAATAVHRGESKIKVSDISAPSAIVARTNSPILVHDHITSHFPVPTIQVQEPLSLPSPTDLFELGFLECSNRSWMNLAFFTAPSTASWLDLSLTPSYPQTGTGDSRSRSRLSVRLMDAFPKPPAGQSSGREAREEKGGSKFENDGEEEEEENRHRNLGFRALRWLVGKKFKDVKVVTSVADEVDEKNTTTNLPPPVTAKITTRPLRRTSIVPLRSDAPSPWVWRCRVAAIIAAAVLLLLTILAIVWAIVGRR
ncbi:hypothetical protein FRB96_003867 [Tulasnella sp. 330]|nr:hypothetical protein FRB96_003867 [Tulasnella sp. 330]